LLGRCRINLDNILVFKANDLNNDMHKEFNYLLGFFLKLIVVSTVAQHAFSYQ